MKKAYFNDVFKQTQAVINGTKTQFRRIVPQKALAEWEDIDDGDEYSRSVYADTHDAKMRKFLLKYAKYKLGEVVAVAMAYKGFYGDFKEPLRTELVDSAGFFNKMFVKPELMPYKIVITKVKVERLQDIPNYSCIEEGIERAGDNCYEYVRGHNKYGAFKSPKIAYSSLIDEISGKGTWERNPWVFVYKFQLIKK